MTHRAPKTKAVVGTVVGDKMQKTIVVEAPRLVQHPLYKKTIKRKIRYKTHDEKNEARCGDMVRIIETRPLSKDKRWRLKEIIARTGSAES